MTRPIVRSAVALASALTVAGLALLLIGMERGAPLVFFGTPREREGLAEGRRLMLLGTLLLVPASALLASRRRAARATLALAPGIATLLVYAFPRASYAWPTLMVLAPAALAAVATTARGGS